jgi:hypothetical protein
MLPEFRLQAPGYEPDPWHGNYITGNAIKSLYGAKKLLSLEFLIHSRYAGKDLHDQLISLGYDPEKALYDGRKKSLYPENSSVNEMEALREFIVRESLNYGLASSETAFIAVYHKAGKRVEATALVPNALPEGWSEDFDPVEYTGGRYQGRKTQMNPSCIPSPQDKIVQSYNKAKRSIMYECSSDAPIMKCEKLSMLDAAPIIFSGKPVFKGNEALLFDSQDKRGSKLLKGAFSIEQLKVSFPAGTPKLRDMDKGLSLLIFVGDMIVPRAVVGLADLIRQRGVRPLNILIDGPVKVVLTDPAGAWAKMAPAIEVSLQMN